AAPAREPRTGALAQRLPARGLGQEPADGRPELLRDPRAALPLHAVRGRIAGALRHAQRPVGDPQPDRKPRLRPRARQAPRDDAARLLAAPAGLPPALTGVAGGAFV